MFLSEVRLIFLKLLMSTDKQRGTFCCVTYQPLPSRKATVAASQSEAAPHGIILSKHF